MASKRQSGVAGVLSGLVSAPPAVVDQQPRRDTPDREHRPKSNTSKRKTRLGRPPGPRAIDRRPKTKATLWITAAVLDEYHDWTWDERCQLGELVERALVHYLTQHRRAK